MTELPQSPWLLLSLSCAVGSMLAFVLNLPLYRRPRARADVSAGAVSVLIPARNEEHGIVAAVESVLASTGVELEVLVLDDASSDRTAELVEAIGARDARVALHGAPPLPGGWNGKQHACAVLGGLARHPVLCFLDADVRLAPGALRVLLGELAAGRADLLSGFPLEETGTWLEKMLIPLIHFVLLCYLPLPGLRLLPRVPSLAAGCGQIMLVRRDAYHASGGHGAIRTTMHDGILLPRLLREHGFATDLFDLTELARCRMYASPGEVWYGLGKNATEGIAAPARIVPFTVMLLFGQIVPPVWLLVAVLGKGPLFWPLIATAAGYLPRALAVWRFRQSVSGAAVHPLGVAVLLVLQWWSLGRKLLRRQAMWKQRAYDAG